LVGAVLGALFFTFFESLSLRLQGRGSEWPSEAYAILLYGVTLLVLFLTARARAAPRALGAQFET
jgi:ABC-type uncharacterized transport system permease subunit